MSLQTIPCHDITPEDIDALGRLADAGDTEAAELLDGLYEDLAGRLDVESAPTWTRDDGVSECHAGQLAVWKDSDAQILVALCGARGGKTALGPYFALREMVRTANWWAQDSTRRKALIIGPTLDLLRKEVFKAFKDLLVTQLRIATSVESPGMKITVKAEFMHRLGCPAHDFEFYFCHASDPNTLESMTAAFAEWDEAGQQENREESWEAANTRLLTARKAGFGRLLITTTPYEFGWLKRRIIDPCGPLAPIGDEVQKASHGRTAVYNWPSWLNPDVDRADIEAEREGMPEWRWVMRYLGVFTQPEDVIYGCWSGLNEIPPIPGGIPAWWRRAVGIDFGLKNTAAVFFAEEQYDYSRPSAVTGRWILYATYHDGDKTAKEHVDVILSKAGGTMRPIVRGGNHAEEQSREAFGYAGLGVGEPLYNDVLEQIACVYAAMKTGNLVAYNTLSKWLEERAFYSWSRDKDGFLTDKPLNDARYHRLAATRYIGPTIFAKAPVTRKLTRRTT